MIHDPSYLVQGLTLAGVFAVALASPGPDFVVAVRHAALYDRRTGVFTALGFGAGVLIHTAYTLMGLAAVIVASPVAFTVIRYAGAAYLAWIGVQALRSAGTSVKNEGAATRGRLSDLAAFRAGFLTNILNVKACLFFLSVFTQIVKPGTPLPWLAAYALGAALMTAGWFSALAFLLDRPAFRARFVRASAWIDRVCGAVLLGLAARLAFSSV